MLRLRHQVGLTVLLAGASACTRNADAPPEAQLATTRAALIEPRVNIGDDIPRPSDQHRKVRFAGGHGQEFMLGLSSWYDEHPNDAEHRITRISAEGVQRNLRPVEELSGQPLRFDGAVIRSFWRFDDKNGEGKSHLNVTGMDDEFEVFYPNLWTEIVARPSADLGPHDADCTFSQTCLLAWHEPTGLFVVRVSDKDEPVGAPSALGVVPAAKPSFLRVLHAGSAYHLFWTNPGSLSHLTVGEDGKATQAVDTLYEAAGASIDSLDVAHNDHRVLAVFTATANGVPTVMGRLLTDDGSVLGADALTYDEITAQVQIAGAGNTFALSYGDRVSFLDQDGVVQGSEPLVPHSPSGLALQNVVIASNQSRYLVAGHSLENVSAQSAEQRWRSYGSIFDVDGKVLVPVFDAAQDRVTTLDADLAWDGEQYVAAWSIQHVVSGVRVSAAGTPVDTHNPEFVGNSEQSTYLERVLSNGKTALLITSSGGDLYATAVDRSGAPGTPQLISDPLPYGRPGAASDGTNYLVAFKGNDCKVIAVRVAADGTPQGASPITLATSDPCGSYNGDVFVAWNGASYLVTWFSRAPVAMGSGGANSYLQWAVFVSPDGKASEPLTLSRELSVEQLGDFEISTACSPDECVFLTPTGNKDCQLHRIDDEGKALDEARRTTCGSVMWDGKAFLLFSLDLYKLNATWIWPGGRASKSNLVETLDDRTTWNWTGIASDGAGNVMLVYNSDADRPARVRRIHNDAEPGEVLPLVAVTLPDAGMTADGSVQTTDGGVASDGGGSTNDAGCTLKCDAGHAQTDAGHASDSGTGGSTDAGTRGEDAGMPRGKAKHGGGCSLRASERGYDSLALQLLAAVTLITRRRRREHRAHRFSSR
jgi:hypothetical protein